MAEVQRVRRGPGRPGTVRALTAQQRYRTLDAIKADCTVDEHAGCWVWNGARASQMGYAKIGQEYGHRLVYAIVNGPIPDGLVVRHKCDNPPCVNPDHLLAGTHADNMDDRDRRQRWRPRGRLPLSLEALATIMRAKGTGTPPGEVGRPHGLSHGAVRNIWNGRSYRREVESLRNQSGSPIV